MSKQKEKQKAIKLRKHGYSYSEILKQVPVAKSTLSLWLQSVGLSKQQKQRLTKKKLESALRGARRKREQKIALINKLHREAEKDIKKITKRELWLIGIMLYWAEGSKEKDTAANIQFSNSDPVMIKLFLKWLIDICNIGYNKINFSIYIHENHKHRLEKVINYWVQKIGLSKKFFTGVYFKKGNPKTKRTNVGNNYYGVVRIRVRESSDLNRKIVCWVHGVAKYYRVV
jgi:cell division protein FtsB